MIANRVALITGVSSGIGRETARLLAERGVHVFGTVRDPSRMAPIANAEFVLMDVTDDTSVKNAVKSVLDKTGKIDILINNAGYSIAGALEETSVEEAHLLFETNFFGVLRVTQSVLPSMRFHGYGRIVNISSMLGVLPGPYRGMYVASKHALEGYTKTLDHEVRMFGIRAVLVEPVYTRTKIAKNERSVQAAIPAYADQKQRVTEIIEKEIANGDDPNTVAEVVYAAVTARSPRLQYPVGEGNAESTASVRSRPDVRQTISEPVSTRRSCISRPKDEQRCRRSHIFEQCVLIPSSSLDTHSKEGVSNNSSVAS
jgi:NAD(P)-dependent dehydrogenase (short-subunit alcohol dehydrogenase family)